MPTSIVTAQSNFLSIPNSANNFGNSNLNSLASHKTFYLFTAELDNFNEIKLGIPSDVFTPNIFVVNKGDILTIHFYNLDDEGRHTFTVGAPYNINQDIASMHDVTFTFRSGHEGVYQFYCKYHLPTMIGQLVVLPPTALLNINPGNNLDE